MIPKPLPYHTYNVSIAKKIGVLPALLIHHFCELIIQNKHYGKPFVNENKVWVIQTFDNLNESFPEYSKIAIKKVIKKLKDLKIIEIGHFNKTNWYTIIDQSILDIYNI